MEGKGWLVRWLEKAWPGDRSGNAFDGGRMKEQSGIVNGSRSSTLATAFVATRDR